MSIISERISRPRRVIAGYRTVALAVAMVVASMTPGHSALAQDSAPDAKVTACSNQISTCGCTITKSGFYEVTANLFRSQGLTALGGCIDIKASKVILGTGQTKNGMLIADYKITGPGPSDVQTEFGVHILKGSNNDFLELPGTISGWAVGILVEGNNNVIEDFNSSENLAFGLWLNNASNNTITGFSANANLYSGLWLRQSSNNRVSAFQTNNNNNIGVYVGCFGPVQNPCKGVGPSKGNQIFDGIANSNGNYGIFIDSGDSQNLVNDTVSSGNSKDAVFDANSNCDHNNWFFNQFDSSNVSCIQ